MRPKVTSLQRKEATRRKNREHWSTHKHEITARRNLKLVKYEQSQYLENGEFYDNDSKMNDRLDILSINNNTNIKSSANFVLTHNFINDSVDDMNSNNGFQELNSDDEDNYFIRMSNEQFRFNSNSSIW